MKNCVFCKIDNSKKYNTIIEETDNFLIIPSIGSLVDGYLLIVYKKHVYSFSKIFSKEKDEYIAIINKYRMLFKEKYGKYPIVFEHGSSKPNEMCASSLIHAHSHILNHNYFNEKEILYKEKFKEIDSFNDIRKDINYIYYKSDNGNDYVSYEFEPISQLMRKYVAKDLNIEDKYNWKFDEFAENIEKTISKFKINNNYCASIIDNIKN